MKSNLSFSVAVSNKYSCQLKIWLIRLQVICVSQYVFLSCSENYIINPETGKYYINLIQIGPLLVLLGCCF